MNYGKYDAICGKRCYYLFICIEFSTIDKGNQLLIITDKINIITILQPSNSNAFLHDYFLLCNFKDRKTEIY